MPAGDFAIFEGRLIGVLDEFDCEIAVAPEEW
jgi:hypothetical protein